MIVLDLVPRGPPDGQVTSGNIAWQELQRICDSGEYPEAERYSRFISGPSEKNGSKVMVQHMNMCINMPSRCAEAWRIRVVTRILEL